MLSVLARFDAWYDQLPGGRRFVYFMLSMSLAVLPLQVGLALGHRHASMLGFTWLCVMTAVALSRVMGLGGRHVYAGLFMVAALGLIGLAV